MFSRLQLSSALATVPAAAAEDEMTSRVIHVQIEWHPAGVTADETPAVTAAPAPAVSDDVKPGTSGNFITLSVPPEQRSYTCKVLCRVMAPTPLPPPSMSRHQIVLLIASDNCYSLRF